MNLDDPVIDAPEGKEIPQLRHRRPRGVRPRQERENQEIIELRRQLDELQRRPIIIQTAESLKPLPPAKAKRPEGIVFMVKPVNQNTDKGGDPFYAHERIIPAKPSNPNEPDPRICVFCMKNVAEEYHYEISADPTPEQQMELKRLHQMHKKEAEMWRRSEVRAERRYAADHLDVTVEKVGRVPDVVAYIGGKEYTAEEYNAMREQEYQHKLIALATQR